LSNRSSGINKATSYHDIVYTHTKIWPVLNKYFVNYFRVYFLETTSTGVIWINIVVTGLGLEPMIHGLRFKEWTFNTLNIQKYTIFNPSLKEQRLGNSEYFLQEDLSSKQKVVFCYHNKVRRSLKLYVFASNYYYSMHLQTKFLNDWICLVEHVLYAKHCIKVDIHSFIYSLVTFLQFC
jgi:hypothetical protein